MLGYVFYKVLMYIAFCIFFMTFAYISKQMGYRIPSAWQFVLILSVGLTYFNLWMAFFCWLSILFVTYMYMCMFKTLKEYKEKLGL